MRALAKISFLNVINITTILDSRPAPSCGIENPGILSDASVDHVPYPMTTLTTRKNTHVTLARRGSPNDDHSPSLSKESRKGSR